MISVFFQDVSEFKLQSSDFYFQWLSKVAEKENKALNNLSLIFCSDDYLLEINRKYLNHDYYTDIVTFDYSEKNSLSGDLFISIDRVKENAQIYNISFLDEINRVIVHGVLHLCGYKDKTKEEELLMRTKENESLLLLK